MALFKFVDAIENDREIDVFGEGAMQRDFTFIDDLVDAVVSLSSVAPTHEFVSPHDSLSPSAPCRTVNIAHGTPLELEDFISAIERAMGRRARKNYLPMQPGDVVRTHADPALLNALVGRRDAMSVEEGVDRFVRWFREYRAGH